MERIVSRDRLDVPMLVGYWLVKLNKWELHT